MENNSIKTTVADRLKELRDINGITQKELADAVGLSRVTIGTYEKGSAVPQTDTLIKIAETYNVSMDWLCGLSEKVKNTDLKTYEDLFRQIINMHTVLGKCLKNYIGESYNTFKIDVAQQNIGLDGTCWVRLSLTDEIFHTTMLDYNTMTGLFQNKTISQDVYNLWLDGKMKELSKLALTDFGKSPFDDDDLPF